jgi:serine/threonine protein kinase/Tfp pilus assembly protein PilF
MIGRHILHYRILEELGRGGMGVVYRAEDLELERSVAIKFLPASVAGNTEERERFKREAKAAAALNHANICTIHAIEEAEGETFIVMEHVEGQELKDRLRTGPLGLEEALAIAGQLARGLAAAHARGIVHRDIKSANIMLSSGGQVKIMDFGLAKVRGSSQVTKVGTTVGTAAYMSPEQARGEEVDQRSDLWSLGVVLYEMLTGRLPFQNDYDQAVIYAILNQEPESLRALRPELPDRLEQIVTRAMAKDPAARFQTAGELVAALQHQEPGASSRRESSLTPEPSSRRRKPLVGVAAGAAVIVAAILTVVFIVPHSNGQIHSIAVLPFLNESGDADNEYLSDGITESLIGHLSPMSGLRVMARSTVFQFKGKAEDPREVGRSLDVGAVLAGRVDQRGDRLLVSAELIDVNTGAQLWGDRFNRQMADVFSIEEEISRSIARELQITLGGEEQQRLARRSTDNTEAYQLYLRGRYHWNRRSTEGMSKALEYFREAVEKDPSYALAWCGMADTYIVGAGIYLGVTSAVAKQEANRAVLNAIRIDPELAEAHTSLAAIKQFDRDWEGSEASFRRAIELNPGYATAHQWYAELLYATGRFAESEVEIKRALEIDPLSLIMNSVLGWTYLAAREAPKAIDQFHKTLEMEPQFFDAISGLFQALLLAGRPESEIYPVLVQNDSLVGTLPPGEIAAARAGYVRGGLRGYWRARLEVLMRHPGESPGRSFHLAECYAQLGEIDKALDALEESVETSDALIDYIRIWVPFDPVRSDPRYRKLLEKLKLPA